MRHSLGKFIILGACTLIGAAAMAQNTPPAPPQPAVRDHTPSIHPNNVSSVEIPQRTRDQVAPSGVNQIPAMLAAGGPNVDCVCDQRFNVGDRVASTVDMPDGNDQIRIGDVGTVVCGREFGADDLMLIRWDITNGHDGLDACTCPTQELPVGSTRGWYVFCDELERVPDSDIDCVCGDDFYVGQTVVAAVDNPQGNGQIAIGEMGTVVCGREFSGGGEDLMLVSWDIDNGHDGFEACACPGDELPVGSNNGWYVFCNELQPYAPADITCVCGAQGLIRGRTVVATEDNPSSQSEVLAGEQGMLICGSDGLPPALIAWDTTTGHDGNGFCECPSTVQLPSGSDTGWYVDCDELRQIDPLDIDCVCPDQFDRGDKVVSLIDNNGDNDLIDAGHVGTVICGREFGTGVLLVAWDIDNGNDGFDACDCPTTDLPTGSETGWYVFCDTIAPVGDGIIDCVCDAEFQPGDQIRVTVDNPDGNPQILAGDTGTVICGREFSPSDLVLVAWDITNGHDGFDTCTCPTDELPGGSITGWYVLCSELALVSDCPGDIDGSGSVGFPDLLRVLSTWGPCVGCPEDLDDDGAVGFSDLLVVLSGWGPC